MTVVSGAEGARLQIDDHRSGQICLRLREPPLGRVAETQTECGYPPRRAGAPLMVDAEGLTLGMAVSADVAQAELVTRSGRTFRIPTEPGVAYRGRAAGRLRFALLALGPGDSPDPAALVRLLAIDGSVIGATDSFRRSVPGTRGRPVARGGSGTEGWVATVEIESMVAPVPGKPERRERHVCLTVATPADTAAGGACTDDRPLLEPAVGSVGHSCGPSGARLYATGFADRDVRRVAIVLGDGGRLHAPTRPLPATIGLPAQRFFVTAVPAQLGVRRIVALDRRGREVGTGLTGASPPATAYDCEARDGFLTGFGFRSPPRPGGDRLNVADRGDYLCVALGRLDPRGTDCTLPPLDANETRIELTHTDRATTVGAIAAAEVAFVEAETHRGTVLRVPTAPLPGYAGQYAAFVRGAVIAFPGRQRIVRVTPLGPDGRRYEPDDDGFGFDGFSPLAPVRTLFRTRVEGRTFRLLGYRLPQMTSRNGRVVRRVRRCAALTDASALPEEAECLTGERLLDAVDAHASVRCAPRVTILHGTLTGAIRTVELGRATATIVRLPGGKRLWVAVLPGAVAAEHVVLRDRGGNRRARIHLGLPAPREQCGFSHYARASSPSVDE